VPRSIIGRKLRHHLQPVHRRVAGALPLRLRRHYLYLVGQGRFLHLDRPRTYSEKVNWRIVHDRRPELAWTCDKLEMKSFASRYSEEIGLSVPETFWAGEDLREILGRRFDRPWVIKPNHRSGLVRIGAPDEPVDERLVEATRGWLADDENLLLGEWAYSRARRMLLIEEKVGGDEPVDDYKFFVFDGKVVCVVLFRDRFSAPIPRVSLHDADWQPLPARYSGDPSGEPADPPANWEAMVRAAQTLGSSFDHMRVDLYTTGDRVWLSELTPYPAGGVRGFEPRSFDTWLGRHWTLPDVAGDAESSGDVDARISGA
jgi:hypothetical protein